MDNPVGIAVVGANGIGKFQVRSAVRMMKAGQPVRLVAVCDLNAEDTKRVVSGIFEEVYGKQTDTNVWPQLPEYYEPDDYPGMVGCDDVHVVCICTPNFLHPEQTIAAFRAGKPVLLEKPPATTAEDAWAIYDAWKASGRPARLHLNNLMAPWYTDFRHYRDTGVLGDVMYVDVEWVRVQGGPFLRKWFSNRKLAGGGAGIDLMLHPLGNAMDALGWPKPIMVSGRTHRMNLPIEARIGPYGGRQMGDGLDDVEDIFSLDIWLENGVVIRARTSWAQPGTQNETFGFHFYGNKGGFHFEQRWDINDGEDAHSIQGGHVVGWEQTAPGRAIPTKTSLNWNHDPANMDLGMGRHETLRRLVTEVASGCRGDVSLAHGTALAAIVFRGYESAARGGLPLTMDGVRWPVELEPHPTLNLGSGIAGTGLGLGEIA